MSLRYRLRLANGTAEGATCGTTSFMAFVLGATVAIGFWMFQQQAASITKPLLDVPHGHSLQIPFLAMIVILVLACFTVGIAVSSSLAHGLIQKPLRWVYGFALMLEACIVTGGSLLMEYPANHKQVFLTAGVAIFSLLLSLQYAMILLPLKGKRPESYTGAIMTNLGIGLGNLIYEAATGKPADGQDKPTPLMILGSIVGFGLIGMWIGTLGFSHFGYRFDLAFAAVLLLASLTYLSRV